MKGSSFEIRTLDEFFAARSRPGGFIVVTDQVSGEGKAHKSSCYTIGEATFREKVLTNGNRNGRYYYVLRFEDVAEVGLRVRRCTHCFEGWPGAGWAALWPASAGSGV